MNNANEINVRVKSKKGRTVSRKDQREIIDTIMMLKNKLGYAVQIDFQ